MTDIKFPEHYKIEGYSMFDVCGRVSCVELDRKYCKKTYHDPNASCCEQKKCAEREWAYYPYIAGNIFEASPFFFSFGPLGLFLCAIFFVSLKRYQKRKQIKESII